MISRHNILIFMLLNYGIQLTIGILILMLDIYRYILLAIILLFLPNFIFYLYIVS